MVQGPAYRIVTDRLVLRAFELTDTTELSDAIAENLAHLRPWLEWVREGPRTLDAMLDLVRRMRGRFDLGDAFSYVICDKQSGAMIGGCVLTPHPAEASGTIGYWLAETKTGHGLGTEAAAALVRVAFEVDHLELLEIHSVSANERSARVAERLGFVHDGTLRARLRSADGSREDRDSWSMLREEYDRSKAAHVKVQAYDALGRAILDDAGGQRRSAFR
jgi:RimJ/RimL family protein N-acetyltransferase